MFSHESIGELETPSNCQPELEEMFMNWALEYLRHVMAGAEMPKTFRIETGRYDSESGGIPEFRLVHPEGESTEPWLSMAEDALTEFSLKMPLLDLEELRKRSLARYREWLDPEYEADMDEEVL